MDVPKQRRRGAKRIHSHADADVRYLLVRKGFLEGESRRYEFSSRYFFTKQRDEGEEKEIFLQNFRNIQLHAMITT